MFEVIDRGQRFGIGYNIMVKRFLLLSDEMASNQSGHDTSKLNRYRETASQYASSHEVIRSVVDKDEGQQVPHVAIVEESLEGEDFKQYLRHNGIQERTIDILFEEEIINLETLNILSDDDFEKLNLKLGQKARIRNLKMPEKLKSSTYTGNRVFSEEPVSPLHEIQRGRKRIKQIQKSRPYSNRSTDDDNNEGRNNGKINVQMRQSKQRTKSETETGGVELNYHCLKTENKGKVVIALSTFAEDEIKQLPARILLLVDISGSMGIRYGSNRRHSKLSRMKKFASSMVDTLDDGDYASLVTFGKDVNVLLPMRELNSNTRKDMKKILETLDKTYLSTKTNLGEGLSTALDVFHEVCSGKEDLQSYRNAIIVFSDGEINEGTTNPSKLVHEVREKIRKLSFGLDDSQNQWVSISAIATGNELSEAMYMLSKYCSSDAFYHLDVTKNNSEVELFLPVLLRKAAVAWNVSLFVQSLNGASIINEETSQENKVRLRSSTKSSLRQEKAYFYYDIPAASKKHVGIAINLQFADEEPETEVLKLSVKYTDLSGERRELTRAITRQEIESEDKEKLHDAITENMKHDARLISQNALQKAADAVKDGKTNDSADVIQTGQSDLKMLLNKYGQMAEDTNDATVRPHIITYADTLMQSMQNLLDGLETSIKEKDPNEVDGKTWSKIQAVSSAISREAPTISDAITDSTVLTPLPNVRRVSSNLQHQMENLYKQQGAHNMFTFEPNLASVAE